MNHRDLFYRYVAQTSPFPLSLEIERAEGLYMFGPGGKSYMDMISGISVSALGHRHPAVTEAVKNQVDKYMHLMVYGEFIQSPQVMLAELLVGSLPESLDNVYFVNSGSEAIEGAVKLAKRFTGRTEIVGFVNAYHGSSHGSLSVTGNETLKQAFRPLLPDIRHLPFNSEHDLAAITERTACVVAETIQGEAGAVVPDAGFMLALRRRCNETGALLVLDEIQAGMGRTGKLWAFEHFDIVPDVLVLAKGFGGGMPIGAFVASKEVMQSLTYRPVLGHISTFGGNAVCAAAAHATLKTILQHSLWKNAAVQEKNIRKWLNSKHILSIKGKGLLLALQFEDAVRCKMVIDRCIDNGLLTDWFLFADNCMRLAPPLIITTEQTRKACEIIGQSVKEIFS
ncbi:MAG: aspartate aminotransferase family protein [Bacteroidia bacterium]|nr:MAG: aspartate aminotransferase family protein [Bacteroidia bacterium]